MSANNFLLILARALEARDDLDASDRRSIYETSRRTLERFFQQNPSMDAASCASQRAELETAITEIERRYTAPVTPPETRRETGAARPLSPPPRPTPAPPPAAPKATPAPATPPLPPVAAQPAWKPATEVSREPRPVPGPTAPPPPPQAPAQAPAPPTKSAATPPPPPAAPPRAAAPEADRTVAASAATAMPNDDVIDPHRIHDPQAMEALFSDEEAASPTASDDEVVVDESERRKHNRRGTILLVVVVVGLVLAYETGWLELARRLAVGGPRPNPSVQAVVPGPDDLAATGEWKRIAETRLADTGAADRTATYLRITPANGGTPKDHPGRITWTRSGGGDTAELEGQFTFTDTPVTMEIMFEPDTASMDGFSRLAMIATDNLPEPILEVGPLQRVDPTTGHPKEVEGISTRIGLDRVLYGFRPLPQDDDRRFDRRSVLQFTITLESGERLQTVLRLPPPPG
jgi:hypothetical protein